MKSTPYTRQIAAIDPDALSPLITYGCKNAYALTYVGFAKSAAQTLAFRVFTFCEGMLIGVTPSITLTSVAAADIFGQFSATPTAQPWIDVVIGTDQISIKVDAVTGSWTLNGLLLSEP